MRTARAVLVASAAGLLICGSLLVATPAAAPGTVGQSIQSIETPPPLTPRSQNPAMWIPAELRNAPEMLPARPRGPSSPDAGGLVEHDPATNEDRVIPRTVLETGKSGPTRTAEWQGLWTRGEGLQQSVIGTDDRRLVSSFASLSDFPWRTIARLFVRFGTSWFVCSGSFTGMGTSATVGFHVLTAGHCVHNGTSWADEVQVVPAYDNGYMPFGRASATTMVTTSAWLTSQDPQHDIAWVEIDRPFGTALGFMGRRTAPSTDPIYTSLVNTAGYPGDLDSGERMYYDADAGAGATANTHDYLNDTGPGMTGSPVWLVTGELRELLSVHTSSGATANSGTRLSQEKFDWIAAQTADDVAPPSLADLLDDNVTTVSSSLLARGAAVTVQPTLRNLGTSAAGAFRVSFYLSTDTTITSSDYYVDSLHLAGMPAFFTAQPTWSGRIPATVPIGTYYLGWLVDDQSEVGEYAEDNNVGMLASPVTVASGPAGDTDLDGDGLPDVVWRNSVTGELNFFFLDGGTIRSTVSGGLVRDLNWKVVATADFNNDGKGDLFWRHAITGENKVWLMDGANQLSEQPVLPQPDMGWDLVAAADFNQDRLPDLLWHREATNETAFWFMSGTTRTATAAVSGGMAGWSPVGAADLSGDGHPDILWRNYSTGENYIWYMNGVTYVSGVALVQVPDTHWRITSTGDYNGDLSPDILWRHTQTGMVVVWYLNRTTLLKATALFSVDAIWDIMHRDGPVAMPCDFNIDAISDVFWRNDATGENVVWFMNGGASTGHRRLLSVTDTTWRTAGFDDFNADGRTDILWRNAVSGENVAWFMNGTSRTSYARLLTVSDTSWKTVGTGDFNADGKPDILWRNAVSGENVVWFMNGASRTAYARLATVSDTAWKIVGTGDFNMDGKRDILWRHATSGENAVWLMNGTAVTRTVRLLTVADVNFAVASVGDFNEDGKADILWRSYATGQNVIWYMDGAVRRSYAVLPTVTDTNWRAGTDSR